MKKKKVNCWELGTQPDLQADLQGWQPFSSFWKSDLKKKKRKRKTGGRFETDRNTFYPHKNKQQTNSPATMWSLELREEGGELIMEQFCPASASHRCSWQQLCFLSASAAFRAARPSPDCTQQLLFFSLLDVCVGLPTFTSRNKEQPWMDRGRVVSLRCVLFRSNNSCLIEWATD